MFLDILVTISARNAGKGGPGTRVLILRTSGRAASPRPMTLTLGAGSHTLGPNPPLCRVNLRGLGRRTWRSRRGVSPPDVGC